MIYVRNIAGWYKPRMSAKVKRNGWHGIQPADIYTTVPKGTPVRYESYYVFIEPSQWTTGYTKLSTLGKPTTILATCLREITNDLDH